MFKSSKSYSRKSSHKREAKTGGSEYHHINTGSTPYITSPPPSVRNGSLRNEQYQQQQQQQQQQRSSSTNRVGGDYSTESHYIRGGQGQLIPINDRFYDTTPYGGQAFSESSAYETHEHYEKKIKKKTRGERDRRAANGVSNGSLKKELDSSNFQGNIDDIISRLTRGIGIVNEKLDLILKRIEDIEQRADSMEQSEVKKIVQEIVDDLGALEAPINDLFDDVDILKDQNHPRANEFYKQVYGLHQRRLAYLDRLGKGLLYRLGMFTDNLSRQRAERTKTVFESLEEAIRWVRERLDRLNNMVFHEDLEALEELFEQHKLDNRDIQDFHQTVKECIARQAEVSAEDSHEYCELLRVLESEYQQLRDLSAGRMLDLDSLIAFIRAAQLELIWIHEREDIEVSRNWSDINQLDLPMLQNYYKQLLHEIELREKQFNDVHNQGAALVNQRHPASDVIEIYLRSLQNQWDWLLGLTKCLEGHLRDALNLKSFQEEVAVIEEWIRTQTEHLENNYNRTDFTVEEGERWLRELNEIRDIMQKYHSLLMSLAERCAHISPLWQRGERIRQPINVTAWCDYKGKDIEIRTGEDVTLLDNSDLISWTIRGVDGVTAQVPSVVFRIPPPDAKLTNLLSRLAAQLDKMRKLWDRKHRMIRYNMMMSTMKSIQGWDLDTFLQYPPEQRDEIIKALNDDVNKLHGEMDPNDPLALRLKEELKRTNDHFLDLLNQSLRGQGPDASNQYDAAIAELLKKLEEAWKKLNERTSDAVPKNLDDLEQLVNDHRAFEDALQSLDTDVSNVKELFRQLPNPTPTQRANHDYLNSRWEDLWDLSRMYVERLKVLQQVLQGIAEVNDIVRRHEITLSSFDDMPAALDKLRGVHSQLLELNMVLQQQENIIHSLNQNVAKLRQHVARTRLNSSAHPDVDRLEDQVSQLTVRWDNVCSQVSDRLKTAEDSQQTQMVYRSQYDEEIQWLDRVEQTINNLRRPEQLRPEELQGQLDLLMAEYSQLQEHTATIENINKEGGKFIREAKNYDNKLDVFRENISSIHGPTIRNEFRRTEPQPKNGAQIVTEELEALNRRFAQLSSVILERRNQLGVLIQNWKRKQQESFQEKCSDQTIFINKIIQNLQQIPNVKNIELDFSTADSTSNARIELLKVRENLAKQATEIENALREADRLCNDGAEILTPEQFNALKESRQKLQHQYKSIIDYTDNVLKRLDVATSLLIEFTKKSTDFQNWIYTKSKNIEQIRYRSGNPSRIDESKREAKNLHDEIINNEDSLREINQIGLRIEVEVKNYIDELKRQDPSAKHPPMNCDEIQNTIGIIQGNYETLIKDSNGLIQFLNKLKSLSIDYDHHITDVNQWLTNLEKAVHENDPNVTNTNPEELLEKLKNLNENAIANQPKLEAAIQASKELVDATISTDSHDVLKKQQEMILDDMKKRFNKLNDKLGNHVDNVKSEIINKEGVKQGLNNMIQWLDKERRDTKITSNLPLIMDKLKEKKYLQQIKETEMNSQEKILNDLEKNLEKMKQNNLKNVQDEKLDEKFKEASDEFVKLKRDRHGYGENLYDVINAMENLNGKIDDLNKKLNKFNDDLDKIDPTDENGIEKMERIFSDLIDNEWNDITGLATKILNLPGVEETQNLNELMKGLEKSLNRTQNKLSDKHNASNKLANNKVNFGAKFEKVEQELSKIEGDLQGLILDISIDENSLQEQREICQEIHEQLLETRTQVEEIEKLGTELIQTSGIVSKRKSMDLTENDGIGLIAKQIFGLRSRQDEAERVLHDLNLKINENDEKRKNFNEKQLIFKKWLDDEESALKQRQNTILEQNALENACKEIKMVNKKFHEKQSEIGQLYALMNQLMNLAAYDSRQNEIDEIQQKQKILNEKFQMLEKENSELEIVIGTGIVLLNDASTIEKWINSKSKVLEICNVNADENLMNNNLVLLDYLANEMEDEKSKYLKFNQIGNELKEISKNNDFKNQIENKMDEIDKKWKNLEENLKKKIDDLNNAKNMVKQFDEIEKNIKKNLHELDYSIDDGFKTALVNPQKNEEYIKMLDNIDFSSLSNQLNEMEKIGEKMDELLIDSGIRSEIKNRINTSKNSIDEMGKKIDSMKNAAMSSKNQGDELLDEYENAIEWINNANEELNGYSGLTADNEKLKEQIDKFDDFYKTGLEKEGSMMLLKAKMAEAIDKSANSKEMKEKLEILGKSWDPLLNSIKEKYSKMKNLKELIDEFGDLEVDIKNNLSKIQSDLEEFKEKEKTNENLPENLETTKEILNLTKPKIDGLFNLSKKIDIIAPGPDSKKLNRDVENLLNDYDVLTKELTNQTKIIQTKNDLKNNFEKLIISATKMLENVEQNLKNDDLKKSKEKLQNLDEDVKNNFSKMKREIDSTTEKLKSIVDEKEMEEMNSKVDNLEVFYGQIIDQISKLLIEISKNDEIVTSTMEKNYDLKNEIENIGEQILDLQSIGRDMNELEKQKNECDEIDEKINKNEEKINILALEWKNLVDDGKVLPNQFLTLQKELEQMKHKNEQQKKKINNRKRQINDVIDGINNLSNNAQDLYEMLEDVENDEIFKEPIGVELNELRRQQQAIKQFKSNDFKPLTEKVDEIVENAKEFIRSADPDVQTNDLEKLLKQLTGKMNDINASIDEKERKIEGSIQGLGLYNDSYKSLLNWIEEVEEIVANQKPPSADYKVTKAQLQTHDFQMKLIDDKQSSIDGFLAMMDKVYALAQDDESKASIKAKADDISSRYNSLVEDAHQRRIQLLEASSLGEEFSSIVKPLTQWLEITSKEIHSLTSIPTNKEKLDKQIKSQEELLDIIDSKRDDVDHLWNVYTELSKYVGSDDAIELETTITTITEKYNDLGLRCKSLGTSLTEMKKSITSFLEDADNLSEWLDYTEKEIERFGDMSIYPEELAIQSEMLANLVNSVVQRQDLVSRVVQDSTELCRHTSGSEALSLQYRIENLRHRYSNISKEADDKITTLTMVIPLSEEISTIFGDLNNFIDECSTELENLELLTMDEQNNLLLQLENDLITMKNDLENLNEKSMELQHLSSRKKADELAKKTNELNHQFQNLSDKIMKKSDNLNLAEKQSRKLFDDLDYLYDWFIEARNKIENSEKPTIDIERLKLQIKNQKLMNDDITTEKIALRELIGKSKTIIEDLKFTIGEQHEISLLKKMDDLKKLSDDVSNLGNLRLEELEQSFVLSKELESSYTEISEWLEQKDLELRNCEVIHTGMLPEHLVKLKNHNNIILQNYRDEKPIIMKFERNVGILSNLTSKNESENLSEILNGIIERFNEQEQEFIKRGKILDETIEQSSVFGDRLDTFLSNLESANNKIRNPEPVSSNPTMIQSQINDNQSIIGLFNQKEDAFRNVKNDANTILTQCLPGDPTVSEISQKINELDILWFEIQDGLQRRSNFLSDTLQKAEKFWKELDNCQKSIIEIKNNLNSIQLTTADPKKLEENQVFLNNVGIVIDETKPKIQTLRYVGDNLIQNIADDEKQQIEYQMNMVENDMITVTGIYNSMTNNLIDAMSKSMNFHDLLRQLLIWLNSEENNLKNLGNIPNNLTEIQSELAKLEKIRGEIDEKSILREQLNYLANELYLNAKTDQINGIRGPMNDLNGRWNKLYQFINERQQKLEKLLLELGQFEQAYQQLISWIDKTDKILEEISPKCKDLKQIEIEFCKLKVIQNDIQSHFTTFDEITKIGKQSNPEKIGLLQEKWTKLNDKVENLWKILEISKNETTNQDSEYDRWILWLDDLLSELSFNKPIGGLIETAENQLDDFQIIKADVEEKRNKIENLIDKISNEILINSENSTWLKKKHDDLEKNWKKLNEKMVDRETKLKIALRDAHELEESMNDMTKWLDDSENHLNNLPLISRLIEPLEKQIDQHQIFTINVNSQREKMSDLNTRGTKIQFTCEKKDAIPIKNRLISLKHRFDKVANRTADRTKLYDNAFGESQTYFNSYADLSTFLDRISQTLKDEEQIPTDSSTGDRLRNILEENKKIIEEIHSKKPFYETTEKRGKTLEDHSPSGEKSKIHEYNLDLTKKWKNVNSEVLKRQRSIEDALVQCGKFDEALAETFSWLNSKLPILESEIETGNILGDNDTVERLNSEHCVLGDEMKRRKIGIEQLKNRSEKILESSETSENEKNDIQEKMNKLENEWERLEKAWKIKDEMLTDAIGKAFDLHHLLDNLNEKGAKAEERLKKIGNILPDEESEVLEMLNSLKEFEKQLDEKLKPEVEKAMKIGKEIQKNVHPKAEIPLKNILRTLSGRWDSIDQQVAEKNDKLKKHLDELKEHDEKLEEMLEFIGSKESAIEFVNAESEPSTLTQLEGMKVEHDLFKQELNEKQGEIDEILRIAKKNALKSESSISGEHETPAVPAVTPTTPTTPTAKTPKPLLRGNTKMKILQPKKSKRLQKSEQLSDRWKKLWEHSQAYDEKLKARKEYLDEMKRLEYFTFDDWRERYLQWNDTGKSRISDLFRKIDISRTGIIPRESFIKGILDSKFPTTKLEMIKVANEFDKGDGMISAKEFMNALRYDPKTRPPPKTEAEIIHEELRKETERCKCAHRFPITHISTNENRVQYGFGFGSTMKRMVRILRSTVMVRVGGGWERLDEFLVKHDPCRASGRLNINLHQSPDNALDQMHEFKTRRYNSSGSSSLSGSREVLSYVGTPGPISKVREKTDRSVPMFKKPQTPKTSVTGISPLASYTVRRASDMNYGDSKIPRPSPTVSRSSSRQNISQIVTPVSSRPPSRMSGDDPDDRPPSRIPSIRGAKGVRYQPGSSSSSKH